MGLVTRHVQGRHESSQEWEEVANGIDEDIDSIEWAPPKGGNWFFRQRGFDDVLKSSDWVYSGPFLFIQSILPARDVVAAYSAATQEMSVKFRESLSTNILFYLIEAAIDGGQYLSYGRIEVGQVLEIQKIIALGEHSYRFLVIAVGDRGGRSAPAYSNVINATRTLLPPEGNVDDGVIAGDCPPDRHIADTFRAGGSFWRFLGDPFNPLSFSNADRNSNIVELRPIISVSYTHLTLPTKA